MLDKKFLMPLLCLVVVLSLSATATRGANILFVASMTAEGDDTLKAFMEGLGHTVTYIDDNEDEAATEAAAIAADMVFISESVGSGNIKNEITELEVPMIVAEMYAWDEMGLTEGGGGDNASVTTDVDIVDPAHYLAAGLSGTVAVLTDITSAIGPCNLGKGITGPEATVIAKATLSDGVTYDVIFVYEKGAALPVAPADGSPQVAADIRIGFGFHANCTPVLSDNAYTLLEAAINYALGQTGPAAPPAQVLERRVAASDDDSEEHVLEGGLIEGMTSSDLELGYESGTSLQTIGIRLLDIQIPQGATITSAWVQFSADDINNDYHALAVSLVIEGEMSPNAAVFTENAGDITSRLVTTASVVWDVPQWMQTHLMGPDEQTPDISAVIQEIVNQPDWAAGNAMVLLFRDNPANPSAGTREAESFDGEPAEAALLHIEYTEAAPPAGANIIWVSDNKNPNTVVANGTADQGFVDLLRAAGYTVDYKGEAGPESPEYCYWRELDDAKIAELNAADLIIVGRDTNSGDYDDGDEPTQWNSVTTPLILQVAHIARSSRWLWMNSSSTTGSHSLLEAVDPGHEIFNGVNLDVNNQVDILVPNLGVDFVKDIIDAGNGTVLAKTADNNLIWIATWETGQEFYTGLGQTAGGPRMWFAAGSTDSQDGEYNLNAEGDTLYLNLINYMLTAGQ